MLLTGSRPRRAKLADVGIAAVLEHHQSTVSGALGRPGRGGLPAQPANAWRKTQCWLLHRAPTAISTAPAGGYGGTLAYAAPEVLLGSRVGPPAGEAGHMGAWMRRRRGALPAACRSQQPANQPLPSSSAADVFALGRIMEEICTGMRLIRRERRRDIR